MSNRFYEGIQKGSGTTVTVNSNPLPPSAKAWQWTNGVLNWNSAEGRISLAHSILTYEFESRRLSFSGGFLEDISTAFATDVMTHWSTQWSMWDTEIFDWIRINYPAAANHLA